MYNCENVKPSVKKVEKIIKLIKIKYENEGTTVFEIHKKLLKIKFW
jgi:hypothetical protein